jgi:hypothetical protein
MHSSKKIAEGSNIFAPEMRPQQEIKTNPLNGLDRDNHQNLNERLEV